MKSIKQQLEELRGDRGQIRNLAFYKEDYNYFTQEEFKKIQEFVGDTRYTYDRGSWVFDNGYVMYSNWSQQESNPNFKNCTKVKYEDIFGLINL